MGVPRGRAEPWRAARLFIRQQDGDKMRKVFGALWIGGGLAALGAAFLAVRKSGQTTDAIKEALAVPPPVFSPPGSPAPAAPATPPPSTTVKVHTTGYWPFSARADEVKMEGGLKDRKGNPLYTLEMFQAGKAPYVSVSGDDEIWPYGQRIAISAWPGVVFRVVDTGSHFRGANKVYRVMGEEPLDICVDSSKTPVPKKDVTATLFPGDNFASGKAVATAKFKDQTVVTGAHSTEAKVAAAEMIVGAYYDALARGL